MKRIFCTLLLSVLLIICIVPCFASETEVVRVAVIGYPYYITMDDFGNVSGYAYEYLMDISKYTGWKYEFTAMSFSTATVALADGKIDILPGNQYTADRAELWDYAERDMGEGGTVLCALPDNITYAYNDYAAYDGMRIGALIGTVRIDQTKEKLAQYGAEAVFIEYETDAESKEALKKGDVDAILMSTIRCEDDYQIIARVNSTPLFFCTNKNRPELKAELDWAMDEIHLDSPYYEEQLDQKYYGNIKVQNALTSAERDYVASCGVITVALSSDMAPVEYYNHDSGTYVGIVPDVLALISERTGLAFNFVARGDINTLDEQMKNGDVQMIGGVVSKKAVDSPIKLTVTDPFYTNGFVLVVKDGSDVGEDGVMVLKSGYPLFTAIAKQYGYTNIKYADGFKACLDAVKAGNADYTLLPSSSAGLMLDHAYYSELEAYSLPNSSYDFGLGVSDYADPLLISILNKGISAIGDD